MQLALGAVGAGIGSFFGYASIGWSIGSALGNYLFAPDQPDIEGPRLTDRSVSGSTYGKQRPLLYGTYRMSGEIIWAADLKEYAKKEETGGKGGGGGSYTTYTYSASFAVALCEGEISGIRKIWADNKLIYTAADDSSLGSLVVSNSIAKKITVYSGTTTQTADPTIQSYIGVANTPAYRGTAYVVFSELWVTDYGNRIPQLTFEVAKNATETLSKSEINSGYSGDIWGQIYFLDGVIKQTRTNYGDASGLLWLEERYVSMDGVEVAKYRSTITRLSNEDVNDYYIKAGGLMSNPDGIYHVGFGTVTTTAALSGFYLLQFAKVEDSIAYVTPLKTLQSVNVSFRSPAADVILTDDYRSMRIGTTVFFYHFADGRLYRFDTANIENPYALSFGIPSWVAEVDTSRIDSGDESSDEGGHLCRDRSTGDLIVYVKDKNTGIRSLKRYTSEGEFVEESFVGVLDDLVTGNHGPSMAMDNGRLWVHTSNIKVYDYDTEQLLHTVAAPTEGAAYGTSNLSRLDAYNNVCINQFNGVLNVIYLNLPRAGELLSSVVESICNKVGIDSSDIDVNDLASDTVRGYLISEKTPARASLEQLSAAYFFDGRESDGVLEFIKRGDSALLSIDDNDLGCYEGEDVAELAECIRTQEEELPRSLTINYANYGRDYQIGAQYTLRQSVLEGTDATIQLPMAFTDDEAKTISEKLMFLAWENRHKFTFKTWQKYHKVDPADVISARGETLRVITRNEGVNGIIEIEAVRELPQIYTGQIGTGASAPDTGQDVYIGGPTISYLLDVPPLRDQDASGYGFYWAADGVLDDWRGGTLLKYNDPTYSTISTSDDDAVTGYASAVLGNWSGDNTFDETNIIRVNVTGVLETKTETEILNGANLAKLGDELFQFRTATLISTGVYDLSGLLRGRIGTEWAMGSHAENETFVLLSASTLRKIDVVASDLNELKVYGTITYGKTLEDMLTQSFTYSGNNLKPINPVLVGGSYLSGTGWTINWTRRSRYDWQWNNYRDVSNDEPSINYEIAIMNGDTTVRTLTSTTETVTYTDAQQSTDWGAALPILNMRVRQVGQFRNSEWTEANIRRTYSIILNHFNGSNGQTTFTDEYVNTISRGNNAALSTAQLKFGSASLSLPGVAQDYIQYAYTTRMVIGEQDFCIEMFARSGAISQTSYAEYLFDWRTGGGAFGISMFMDESTKTLTFGMGTTANARTFSGITQTTATTMSANTWYWITAFRRNGVIYIVLDTTIIATINYPGSIDLGSAPLRIGADNSGNNQRCVGWYIDDLRVTIGKHRYDSPFVVPTGAFTE